MSFTIVCPLCGYNEQGKPVSFFRDAINNEAWIPYAKHIIDNHQDNFRVHWAVHALESRNIKHTPIINVEHELVTAKVNNTSVTQTVTLQGKDKKTSDITITEYLQKNKIIADKANEMLNPEVKSKLSPSVIAKVREKLAKKKADEVIPENKATNTQVPAYEPEEENPFKDQINKSKK
jgi:hypothetical protein